jgi:hypothetical protein
MFGPSTIGCTAPTLPAGSGTVGSADESVDRAVESTGQLFRLRVLRVKDALESEAIDEGDDLVDQPVQIDVG